MTREEYERRKSAVEAQLAADFELLRAAAQIRLRALDDLWRESRTQEVQDATHGTPASAVTQSRTQATPAQPAAKSLQATRRSSMADVLAVFPQLPEVFEGADVSRLLGYEASRQTLNRAWTKLQQERRIKIETHSDGRRPTRYRKLAQG